MLNKRDESRDKLWIDGGAVVWGAVLGGILGGIITLLFAPTRKKPMRDSIAEITQQARERIETVAPTDPVEESLAVGKEAARRRREQLGLPNNADD